MMAVAAPKKGSLFRRQHIFAGTTLSPIMIYMMFFTLVPMLWGVVDHLLPLQPHPRGGRFLGAGRRQSVRWP